MTQEMTQEVTLQTRLINPVDDTTADNTDGSMDGTEEDNYDNAEQITYWSDINKGSGYWCFMNWLVTGALFIYQQITEINFRMFFATIVQMIPGS